MGLCVFLLICGPVAALMYFPLTTRKQGFHLASAGVSQAPAGKTSPTAKGLDALRWSQQAEVHRRPWKDVA
jgi:hypothetical protein